MPPRKKIFFRRRFCKFCADPEIVINYKEPKNLRGSITERGKIIPRRIFGTCSKHQRQMTEAVKRARHLALLPYSGSSPY